MEFVIPRPLRTEHEELHDKLRAATKEGVNSVPRQPSLPN